MLFINLCLVKPFASLFKPTPFLILKSSSKKDAAFSKSPSTIALWNDSTKTIPGCSL